MKQITRRKILDLIRDTSGKTRDKVDDILQDSFPELMEDGMIDVKKHTEKAALQTFKYLKEILTTP